MEPKQRRDDEHRWLLRTHRQRPRRRRAAEQRDELAALHSTNLSALTSSHGGRVMPRVLAVLRLINR
jgi:hypothetical protein